MDFILKNELKLLKKIKKVEKLIKSDKGLARAMFYGMDTCRSIAAMQKIFVLWMKDEIRHVTGENLLREMMKYKPLKITRIK